MSGADSVISCTPLPNPAKLHAAIAPPLLKRKKSSPLKKLCQSDHPPSPRAMLLPNKSSGDRNCPQSNACSNQNIPQHQKDTCEVAARFMEAIVLTKTPCPIVCDYIYSVVVEAWKLPIEAQDRRRALAGAPVGTPSVCQFPGGPSLIIDQQTQEDVSFEFGLMLLHLT
jgi:hypothetical protein